MLEMKNNFLVLSKKLENVDTRIVHSAEEVEANIDTKFKSYV